MPALGFIGTGTISAAIVRGLKGSPLADWPVLLSPRNAAVAGALVRLPGVTVASDNQAVIDGCDILILAVRPQVAEAVLRPLAISADQTVISLIAGLPIEAIRSWTGAGRVCRAVPLPFVEERRDVIPVFPPDPMALALFSALGQALPVADLATFEIYCAGSALMGTYFGILEIAEAWAVAQGLSPADARAYLSGLFGNLGEVLRKSQSPLHELRIAHSTQGGLNEQVFARFTEAGGDVALADALSGVLARIRAAS
ncbi:pyrroline-5-carboxylate reductase [bacterium]|nr:pyrroline-5-carboxylate reductase [bacterium]